MPLFLLNGGSICQPIERESEVRFQQVACWSTVWFSFPHHLRTCIVQHFGNREKKVVPICEYSQFMHTQNPACARWSSCQHTLRARASRENKWENPIYQGCCCCCTSEASILLLFRFLFSTYLYLVGRHTIICMHHGPAEGSQQGYIFW